MQYPSLHVLVSALCTLIPASTSAQTSLPDGVSYSGVIELEFILAQESNTANDFDEDFGSLWVDADLSYRFGDRSAPLRFGVDLGLYGWVSSIPQSETYSSHAVFAALVVETEYGTLSLGAPRSALDGFFDVPALGGSRAYNRRLEGYQSGLFRPESFDNQHYGLRYDHGSGQFALSASHNVVDVTGTEDFEVSQVGMGYEAEPLRAFLGYEFLDRGTNTFETFFAGAAATFGAVEGGLVLSHLETGTGNVAEDQYYFASWNVTNTISLTATHSTVDLITQGETRSGLSVEYSRNGAFVQAGYAGSNQGTEVLDISVGYEF